MRILRYEDFDGVIFEIREGHPAFDEAVASFGRALFDSVGNVIEVPDDHVLVNEPPWRPLPDPRDSRPRFRQVTASAKVQTYHLPGQHDQKRHGGSGGGEDHHAGPADRR
jgi:hypothetical protein